MARKRNEFITFVRMYQKRAGLEREMSKNAIIPIEDFKTCIRAFKLRVTA